MQLESPQVQNRPRQASYHAAEMDRAAGANARAPERRVEFSPVFEPPHEHDTMLREFHEYVVGLGFAHMWSAVARRIRVSREQR